MDRAAMCVDAGSSFADGSRLLAGEKLTRSQLHVDHDAVLGRLWQPVTASGGIADAVRLSDDHDLGPGVAQACGVRVHVVGIPPARESRAGALLRAADTLRESTEAEVRSLRSLS